MQDAQDHPAQEPRLLSAKEVAPLVGLSVTQTYDLMRKGQLRREPLPGFRQKRYGVTPEAVGAFCRDRGWALPPGIPTPPADPAAPALGSPGAPAQKGAAPVPLDGGGARCGELARRRDEDLEQLRLQVTLLPAALGVYLVQHFLRHLEDAAAAGLASPLAGALGA